VGGDVPCSRNDISAFEPEVFCGGKEVGVIRIDFAKAVFPGAGQVEGTGGAEEDIYRGEA